jgi:bacterioferritin
MKGNQKIIDTLNSLLADELTAINQYMIHSEMCDNGYEYCTAPSRRAIEEMKHAEKLIAHPFPEGLLKVKRFFAINTGDDVASSSPQTITPRRRRRGCNDAMGWRAVGNGSRELMEDILKDEEVHIDWLEAQLDQIDQIGIKGYSPSRCTSPAAQAPAVQRRAAGVEHRR